MAITLTPVILHPGYQLTFKVSEGDKQRPPESLIGKHFIIKSVQPLIVEEVPPAGSDWII